MKTLSVVTAAYNEETNLRLFYGKLREVFEQDLKDYRLELIIVDDGSTDGTWAVVRDLSARDPRVRGVKLSRNFGHQAALTAGTREATGDAVITLDCDLQDPPDVIPKLVAKWREGYDIVYARRSSRNDRFFKKWTADLYYRILSRFSDVAMPRNVGDFRLLDRAVAESLTRLDEHARYLRGMVAWLGYRQGFVDFERPNRQHGETHYTLSRMMRLAMDGILNFTFFPLRIGLWIGLLSILLSGMFLLYMVFDTVVHDEVYPLFKWLTVVLLGFVGMQFMFLWILGEYIGRIYNDVRKRPLYIIQSKTGGGTDSSDHGGATGRG